MQNSDNGAWEDSNSINRRSVLAKLGTGTIAGLAGFSGQAIAESDLEKDAKAEELISSYSTEPNVEDAVKTYASELVDALYSHGHIETDEVSDLVGDPVESEDTTIRVLPDGDSWVVYLIIKATKDVELVVSPTNKNSHAKIIENTDTTITTAEKLTTTPSSESRVGTNNHNGTCYAGYDTCYAGYDPEGSTTCTVIEVYQCDGQCLTHPTSELCSDCTIGDPYPCS